MKANVEGSLNERHGPIASCIVTFQRHAKRGIFRCENLDQSKSVPPVFQGLYRGTRGEPSHKPRGYKNEILHPAPAPTKQPKTNLKPAKTERKRKARNSRRSIVLAACGTSPSARVEIVAPLLLRNQFLHYAVVKSGRLVFIERGWR